MLESSLHLLRLIRHVFSNTVSLALKESPMSKSKEGRQNKTKKHFGAARILTVADALRKKEEREAKEQQVMDEKERRAALRGLVGFAKMVWKEFRMGNDVFE